MDQAHNASGMLATTFLLSLYNLPWFLLAGKMIPGQLKGASGKTSTMIGLSAFWVSIEWAGGSLLWGFLGVLVGYAVGASRHPANASLDRGMERVLFSRFLQSHHRFLSPSPSDPEKEASGWGVFLFLP